MKKFFRLLAVACVLTLGLSGCGGHAGRKRSSAISASGAVSQASSSETAASSQPAQLTDHIPVLMYHSLQYDPAHPENSARIKAESFAAQMKWLHDNGYSAVSLDTLYQGMSTGRGFAPKSVVLTFDDGYGDFYTNGFPVLRQYGFAATVFMISGEIGKAGYLTADQLSAISSAGVGVQDHTVTHPYLDRLAYAAQYKELGDSRTALQAITGVPVEDIAYPYGHYDSGTLKAAAALHYRMGFKMEGGWAAVGDPITEIPRVYVGDSLEKFVTKVTQVQ